MSIKLETANPVRSFKARGIEVVASLLAGHGSRAVVCASAGNLGQALAWSGRGRGLDVTVVASRFAPAAKLDRIRALDARLELVDGDFDMARETPWDARRREEALSKARQVLGPAQVRAAEERGAAMSLATAAEYALLLTAPGQAPSQAAPELGKLSARERELVTLVAQGRTDAQIAAQLYISIRTVRSHLDRIRDKTGCRRRADLTRLALSAELV